MQRKHHIDVIDSLRGLAVLMVLLYHFTQFLEWEWLTSVCENGRFGVHMFFMISGFVIPWSLYQRGYRLKDFFRYVWKRLLRLEPPYLVAVALAAGVAWMRAFSPAFNGVDVSPSPIQILLHVGYLIPFFEGYTWLKAGFWTLSIEFQYYLSMGLIFPLMELRNEWLRPLLFAGLLSFSFFAPKIVFFSWWPVFQMGILVYLFKAEKMGKYEFWFWLAATLPCVFFTKGPETLLVCLLTLVSILYLRDIGNRALGFVGRISYSLYLIHGIVGLGIINLMLHLGPELRIGEGTGQGWGTGMKLLIFGMAMLGSGLAAWLLHRWVEDPARRRSSGMPFSNEKK